MSCSLLLYGVFVCCGFAIELLLLCVDLNPFVMLWGVFVVVVGVLLVCALCLCACCSLLDAAVS